MRNKCVCRLAVQSNLILKSKQVSLWAVHPSRMHNQSLLNVEIKADEQEGDEYIAAIAMLRYASLDTELLADL